MAPLPDPAATGALLGLLAPAPPDQAALDAALAATARGAVALLPGVDDVTVVLTGPLDVPVAERVARLAASAGGPGAALAAAQGATWVGPCVTAMVGARQVALDLERIAAEHPHLAPPATAGGVRGLVASPLRPVSGGAGVLTAYWRGEPPDDDARRVLAVLAAAAGAALDEVRGTPPGRAAAPARAARAVAAEDGVAEAEGWSVLLELGGAWEVDLDEVCRRLSP